MSKLDKIDIHKAELIAALEKTMGIVSTACKKVGLSRQTFYDYYKEDPIFKESVDSIADLALDFAESKLLKSIQNGSDTATIFYLKTKGKKRGYVERAEVELSNKPNETFKWEIIDNAGQSQD